MNCPSCQALMTKSAKFCISCGAKNPTHETSDERLDKHEKEIEDLKKRNAAKKEKESESQEDDDDSLLT